MGRNKAILKQCRKIKRKTPEVRRLHYTQRAARQSYPDELSSLSIKANCISEKIHDEAHPALIVGLTFLIKQ